MKPLVGMAMAAALLGAGWWGWRLWQAPPVPAAAELPAEVTYVCLETGELSRGPRQATPAMNSKLGRATLVQALYCSRCRGWHRMPPAEVRQQMPGGPVCPTTRVPLVETAPEGTPLELVR
jgi:hypothetical protein